MIPLLHKIALIPGQGMLLLPLAVIGMWIHKRRLWMSVVCMACVSMIVNMYLKSYFKVPLAPHLGEGYAYPSGHFQLAFVIWVWMMYKLRWIPLYILTPVCLALYGWGVVVNGYHSWEDVTAAVLAGSVLVIAGVVWEKIHAHLIGHKQKGKAYRVRNILLWGILLLGMDFVTRAPSGLFWVDPYYRDSLFGVYSSLLGLNIGAVIRTYLHLPDKDWLAVRAYRAMFTKIILGFGVVGGICFYGLGVLHIALNTPQNVEIFFLLLGIWVSVGVDVLTHRFCPGQKKL